MKKLLLSMAMIGGFMSANAQMIQTFPHMEDFETFNTCTGSCNSACTLLNGWSNEATTADGGEWTVDVGGTSSSSTGPSVDYNPGTAAGKYLYFETSSPCYTNVSAWMYTPQIDMSAVGGLNMVFAWHMYGATQGTMSIDVSNDFGATWTNGVWSRSGDNGDVWETDTVNLSAWAGDTIIVRIAGTSTTSFTSDMAVDDFIFYEPLPLDAGVTMAYEPGLPSCNLTNSPVSAIFKNFGTDTLVSVDLDWTVNGVPQTTFNWTGSLPSGDQDTASLGIYSFIDGDVLKIWTTNPNASVETGSGPQNDTIEITIQSGLAGIYSIGATGDYLTFTDAVAALTQYGVCSAVTFQADNGTYNERITIGQINGASATNTITFESLNGLASQCILTYAATGPTDNSVVALDGADYITFRDLQFVNTGLTYASVINVDGGAHWNTFDGNNIIGDTTASNTTTSTNKATIVSFTGNLDTMNTFTNNNVWGGSYGMYWYGVNTTTLEEGTVISDNVFDGQYYRGLHLYYMNNITVSNNEILGNNSPYTGSIYSLYLYYNNNLMLTGNKVLRPAKYGYGIYLSNCSASALSPSYVANNFFVVGDTNSTSTSYGIYSTTSNQMKMMNNSVNLVSNGTSSRALYVTGGTNMDVNNNIFSLKGPGYGAYILGGVDEFDNNVYFTDTLAGGVMGRVGYFGGDQMTFADWQAATGWDMNGAYGDPGFFAVDDLHTCNDTLLDGNGIVDSMLTMDVDGQMRDLSAFDIGADEFLGLTAFGFPSDTVMKCSTDVEVLGGWNPQTDGAYLWSSGDTTNSISTMNAGVYTVNVTTACGSAAASVVVENIPDAVASFTSTTSFITGIFTSTSVGADSWSWDFGDGNTSNLENPVNVYPGPGQYIVTLIVSGPCGSDTTTSIFEATIVGINDLDLSVRLEVYPNPNNGVFTMNLTTESNEAVTAEIMNAQGKLVWNKNYTSNGATNETIDLSNLAKGIYVLRMTVDNQVAVKQIVIK